MFKNYALVALRNLFRHKLYSFINIGGLAIGLTAVIIISLFVRHEFSYDLFWENGDKVYRAETTFVVPGRGEMEIVQTPGILQPTMERELSHVIQASSRLFRDCYEISHGENKFTECADFVDKDFFKLFNFDVVSGNKNLILENNLSIMISESVANKYFGTQDVINQILTMNDEPYVVVAVMKDLPPNSHINSDMIGLFDENRYVDQPWIAQSWTSVNSYTYFMLKEGLVIGELNSIMDEFLNNNVSFEVPGLEDIKPTDVISFDSLKVTDIHLHSRKDGNMRPAGNAQLVYTFAGIAILVLVIAAINFMNLSTARATERAREVSMRKVMGAKRSQLINQFLGESLLLTFFGLLLSIVFAKAAMPIFSSFLGQELIFSLTDPFVILSMVCIVVVIGLGAGIYPALILSGFRPSRVLHANNSAQEGSSIFRSALVVSQFAISIGLMIATSIFYGQTIYASNVDMGYEKENRIVIRGVSGDDLEQKLSTFRSEFLSIPGVKNITFASDNIPLQNNNNDLLEAPGGELGGNVLVEKLRIDYNFFQYLGVEPIAGRLFSRDYATDLFIIPDDETVVGNANIIINEKSVGFLGFDSPQDAIGKQTKSTAGTEAGTMVTIVGVVPDIYFRSVREDTNPMYFVVREDAFNAIHIEIDEESQPATLSAIEQKWMTIVPEATFNSSYIEENIDRMYRQERQQATMFLFFSLFAIFVASLGLFGMASFNAAKRTKEIGVRKVLGASVSDIVKLLVIQFSKPVLWANIVAWPVAGYFMLNWLNNFTVRIDMLVIAILFILASFTALLIAWVTVSGHALKAAKSNPIKAIRVE